MLRLVLAEWDDTFRNAMEKALQGRFEVQSCSDGLEAFHHVLENPPDILVLDLVLPSLDGIGLLHRLLQADVHPKVLALTPLVSDYIRYALQEIQVDYILALPCRAEDVAERAAYLTRRIRRVENTQDTLRITISRRLQALGVNPKHRGFRFLQDAIALEMERPGRSMTKEVYPTIANANGVTAAIVERSIRAAIQSAWDNTPHSLWVGISPRSIHDTRPTNGTFISSLAEEMRQTMLR